MAVSSRHQQFFFARRIIIDTYKWLGCEHFLEIQLPYDAMANLLLKCKRFAGAA